MIYTYNNAMPGARVYDVDAKAEIRRVIAVNTLAGWIKVIDLPLRPNRHGYMVTRRIRFGSIHAIKGLEPLPCRFHCYGRKA